MNQSESTALSVEELSELEQLIRQRIQELEEQLPYLNEETQAVSPSCSLGRLTRMEALNDKGVNEHILGETKRNLERLRNALSRMDGGTYGNCIRCGKPMPIGRLRLVPQALICVPCSEKPGRR
ncbi:C4-type zinc finger protein, DksA/TraR family [Salinispira pacifica]|uniref:C4-type zinc finger protein, DksA/TraR family n=2 Tax=Salinispira pacifica TaxID=1307761 RepID=V5WNG1_9SPIO|nr:C4-type zinc finger protein, DksA/TraR family [Salinispira pacifica]